MNKIQSIQGIFSGFLAGFIIFYTLQPNNAYPKFLIELSNKPWILVILFALSWFMFSIDQRLSLLFAIIIIMVVVDIEFLGRKSKNNLLS